MTTDQEIRNIAARVGAIVYEDREGRVSRVVWNNPDFVVLGKPISVQFGNGAMQSLMDFADKFRSRTS